MHIIYGLTDTMCFDISEIYLHDYIKLRNPSVIYYTKLVTVMQSTYSRSYGHWRDRHAAS